MEVHQLMKHPVVSCEQNDTLETAARIMWENDCGCVPVRDGEGRLVGMITDRDVCMAAYLQGGPLRTLYVGSAMSRDVFSVRPDSTVAECQAIMRAQQVRRLPVVDDAGRLVGILSLNDVVRSADVDSSRKKGEVTLAGVGKTLQSVSQPRRGRPLSWVA
jgi:CBS domain-containing protein